MCDASLQVRVREDNYDGILAVDDKLKTGARVALEWIRKTVWEQRAGKSLTH